MSSWISCKGVAREEVDRTTKYLCKGLRSWRRWHAAKVWLLLRAVHCPQTRTAIVDSPGLQIKVMYRYRSVRLELRQSLNMGHGEDAIYRILLSVRWMLCVRSAHMRMAGSELLGFLNCERAHTEV